MSASSTLPKFNSSEDVLVRVDRVSKKFCRSLKRSLWYGVRDILADVNPFARSTDNQGANDANPDATLRTGEFWAVKDISFELRRGECLGLIGRNGAGKTSLLKMLNGLVRPDHGRIEMRGRVGALIALGTGFNPILTGRENIYVNGSVLGLTKREIDAKLDDIIDFADIREFIDSPVQSYSSGMQVRLGFAVATAMEPDVLLLDEVLAVGDAAFRNKCYRRVVSLRKKAAVIFVSHSMDQVARICDRTLVMSKGNVVSLGSVDGGVMAYEHLNDQGDDHDQPFLSLNHPITSFSATLGTDTLNSGSSLKLTIRTECQRDVEHFLLRLFFYGPTGAFAADGTFPSHTFGKALKIGCTEWNIYIDSVPLKRGHYRVAFNIIDQHGDLLVWSYKQHHIQILNTFAGAISDCQLRLASWDMSPPEQSPFGSTP